METDRRLDAYVQTRLTAARDVAVATQFATDAERQLVEYLAQRLEAGTTCKTLSAMMRDTPRWLRSRVLRRARGRLEPGLQNGGGSRAFDYYRATRKEIR